MAQISNKDQAFQDAGNSNIILGTSSDVIIDGLHSGQFSEEASGEIAGSDDKDQIVNQQDQNEIVNPVEIDYENKGTIFTDTNPQQIRSPDILHSDKTDQEVSDGKIASIDENDRLPSI